MPPKVKQMLKEQEEQKIFKQFEELGYKVSEKLAYGRSLIIEKGYSIVVQIYISQKKYHTVGYIPVELHLLLHKLFEIWGWFDE